MQQQVDQQVMEREQHINMISMREQGFMDFMAQHGKTGEMKDKQRTSTAPREGITVVTEGTVRKMMSSLTPATTKWRDDI